MLALACVGWGLSFPVGKALMDLLGGAGAGAGSWPCAALVLAVRFGLGALVLAPFAARCRPLATRSEIRQGLGLGVVGGLGMLVQLDGLKYTLASTSAFLTQCYCVLIPFYAAAASRRALSGRILLASAVALGGIAVLSGMNPGNIRVGRGELETIVASVLFAGQILWLERPVFAGNRTIPVSLVMFGAVAALLFPVAVVFSSRPGALIAAAWGPVPAVLLAVLTLGSTVGAFLLMNRWQPEIDASRAGIIYCTEPLFASFLALFLPAVLAAWSGIDYANETVTVRLVLGGGLIVAANVLVFGRVPGSGRGG